MYLARPPAIRCLSTQDLILGWLSWHVIWSASDSFHKSGHTYLEVDFSFTESSPSDPNLNTRFLGDIVTRVALYSGRRACTRFLGDIVTLRHLRMPSWGARWWSGLVHLECGARIETRFLTDLSFLLRILHP